MLVALRLQNIALIDSVELSFGQGFTVLTGETGAGKSLLLDALDALLGNYSSGSSRLVKSGAKRASVEASFLLNSSVKDWLLENAFDDENPELCLSREWRLKDNRLISRFRINGLVANRRQILSLRPLLIDLTVQGQTHRLADSNQQLNWLDQIGSKEIYDLLKGVKNAWIKWDKVNRLLHAKQSEFLISQEKIAEQKSILKELESLSLEDPLEIDKLKQEQDRLVNLITLKDSYRKTINHCEEGSDEYPSIWDQFALCVNELKAMNNVDPSIEKTLSKAIELQFLFQDLITEIHDYASLLECDPTVLDEVQQRLFLLQKIQRKYNKDIPLLIKYREQIRNSIDFSDQEESIEDLISEENILRNKRDCFNTKLMDKRKRIANKFEQKLIKYLSKMGLEKASFAIKFDKSNPSEKGSDSIQFLFSANPGVPLAPLAEIASGGEMSRFLLALKTILAEVDGSSTLLFDEIDTGVSGRITGSIANLLKESSRYRQVFCVTHQPLIAAAADHHFVVNKSFEEGRTYSSVQQLLQYKDRQKELAELAGGDLIEAKNYAASLLDQHAA